MTADEPTAIRNPGGKVHRKFMANETTCYRSLARAVEVSLSQTAPEDRCRTCWPTTKEDK